MMRSFSLTGGPMAATALGPPVPRGPWAPRASGARDPGTRVESPTPLPWIGGPLGAPGPPPSGPKGISNKKRKETETRVEGPTPLLGIGGPPGDLGTPPSGPPGSHKKKIWKKNKFLGGVHEKR